MCQQLQHNNFRKCYKKSANGFNIAILGNVKKKSSLTMYKIQKIYEKVYQWCQHSNFRECYEKV